MKLYLFNRAVRSAQILKIRANPLFKFVALGELVVELGSEARHFLAERFVVFLDYLATHEAAGGVDVVVLGNFFRGCDVAETSDLFLLPILPLPTMVGIDNLLDISSFRQDYYILT